MAPYSFDMYSPFLRIHNVSRSPVRSFRVPTAFSPGPLRPRCISTQCRGYGCPHHLPPLPQSASRFGQLHEPPWLRLPSHAPVRISRRPSSCGCSCACVRLLPWCARHPPAPVQLLPTGGSPWPSVPAPRRSDGCACACVRLLPGCARHPPAPVQLLPSGRSP